MSPPSEMTNNARRVHMRKGAKWKFLPKWRLKGLKGVELGWSDHPIRRLIKGQEGSTQPINLESLTQSELTLVFRGLLNLEIHFLGGQPSGKTLVFRVLHGPFAIAAAICPLSTFKLLHSIMRVAFGLLCVLGCAILARLSIPAEASAQASCSLSNIVVSSVRNK